MNIGGNLKTLWFLPDLSFKKWISEKFQSKFQEKIKKP
jgi:hypothetical protein